MVALTSRVHLAWGRRGAQQAAERGDMLVVIDTLRFSTAAVTAIHHGALIYPSPTDAATFTALAQRVNGEIALSLRNVPASARSASFSARYTLSPLSYLGIEPGTRVILPSPNGSTCCQYGASTPYLFIGALVNARAVADTIARLMATSNLNTTVLACGERWKTPAEEGILRFALEDYLGAGAILSALPYAQTMEAQACAATFQAMQKQLETALWDCESGQELQEKGLGEDVRYAAQLHIYDTVPALRGECLEAFDPHR